MVPGPLSPADGEDGARLRVLLLRPAEARPPAYLSRFPVESQGQLDRLCKSLLIRLTD